GYCGNSSGYPLSATRLSLWGSYPRPPACKTGALQTELQPRRWGVAEAVSPNELEGRPEWPGEAARAYPLTSGFHAAPVPLLLSGCCPPLVWGLPYSFRAAGDQARSLPPPEVGPGRVELPTSPLSGVRSSQLSYGPDSPGVTTHAREPVLQN